MIKNNHIGSLQQLINAKKYVSWINIKIIVNKIGCLVQKSSNLCYF